MTFQQWIKDQYHTQASEYRRRLQYEVNYCMRVFGSITPEIREVLNKALKEIQPPSIEKWDGNKEGCMAIFESTPKPNWKEILNEFIND
jgi:hypothetical protein